MPAESSFTLPETNISPENRPSQKETIPFSGAFTTVGFQGGYIFWTVSQHPQKNPPKNEAMWSFK